jgi:hypothetical protein
VFEVEVVRRSARAGKISVKLLGHRFTSLPVDNPVGAFFEAMYQTGFYWNFLGLGQVSAGILLLIPATATLGAVCFFPIVLNITVVTWSVGFKGTTYLTALMLLASIFLVAWDWDRLRAILVPHTGRVREVVAPPSTPERVGYVTGTLAVLGVFLAVRGFAPPAVVPWLLGVGVIAEVMVLIAWVKTLRRPRSDARSVPASR